MALGDGIGWDETVPTDATSAVSIDDYDRDLRKGVRLRMANEHEWPSSQAATGEGGKHKFITLQTMIAKPTVSGTQTNAIYSSVDNFFFEKSDGTVVTIVSGTAVGDGKVLANATDAVGNYLDSKLGTNIINSGTNIQVADTAINFQFYGTSVSTGTTTGLSNLIIIAGQATMASGTAVVSNLPFANAFYGLSFVRQKAGDISQAVQITAKSASSFTIRDSQDQADVVHWIAIGI